MRHSRFVFPLLISFLLLTGPGLLPGEGQQRNRPQITGFSPRQGSAATRVVITGRDLTGATSVRIGGSEAPFVQLGPDRIRATVPAGARSGRITVTTPGGTAESALSFAMIGGPTVATPAIEMVRSAALLNQITAGEPFVLNLTFECKSGPERIDLFLDNTPPGTQGTFKPNPADIPPGTTTLTLPTTNQTPSGDYRLILSTIPKLGNCTANAFLIPLTILPPVRLEVSPRSQTLGLGESIDFDVAIRRPTFNGQVRLSAVNLPRGVTATFQPERTRGTAARLTLTASPDARQVDDRRVAINGSASVEVGGDSLLLDVVPRVALFASPQRVVVPQGGTAEFTFDVVRTGYMGLVGLDRQIQGSGGFTSFTEPDGQSNAPRIVLTVNVVRDVTPPGTYTVRVTPTVPANAGPVKTTSTDVEIEVTGVTLALAPAMRQVPPGGSTTYDVTINRGSFTGPVRFRRVTGLPEGATVVPDVMDNPRQITVQTVGSTRPDSYSLKLECTIDGQPPVILESNPVRLDVGGGGTFSLVTDTTVRPIPAGGDSTYTVSIVRQGYDGTVAVNVRESLDAPPPAGVTVTPASLDVDGDSFDLKVDVPDNAPATSGEVSFVVQGVGVDSPSLPTAETRLRFRVTSPQQNTIILRANPQAISVTSGRETSTVVTLSRIGCDAPFTPQKPVALPLAIGDVRFVPIDNNSFRVIVVGGTVTRETMATVMIGGTAACPNLQVQPAPIDVTVRPGILPNVTFTVSPASATIQAGQSTTYTLLFNRGGDSSPLQLAASGLPSGATATFNPNPATGTSAVLTVSTRSDTPAGTFNLALSGTAPGLTLPPAIAVLAITAPPPPAAAPTITSFSPASGPAGTSVTINGTNFDAEGEVRFNGVPAGFSVPSPTRIAATVPPGATTGLISASTARGTAVSPTPFTVTTPAPTISSFTPASGRTGDQVTVNGANFNGVTAVSFNGVNAPVFTIFSPVQLRVFVPLGATTGPIRLTSPAGTATSAGIFTVIAIGPPAITSFSPTSGPVGTSVTVNGTNFDAEGEVRFNGVPASFFVTSSTGLVATVPPGATTGPITVLTGTGTATSPAPFTVATPPPAAGLTVSPPSLSFTAPQGGPNPPLQQIQIGSSGAPLAWTASDNAPWLTVSPASGTTPGIANVTVNVAGLAAGVLNATLTVSSPGSPSVQVPVSLTVSAQGPGAPEISGFLPLSGAPGISVEIAGINFTGAANVSFNGINAAFAVSSPNRIFATVPGLATTGPIRVTTPAGTATSFTLFAVTSGGPVITALQPGSGAPGQTVTIAGANLNGATLVTFAGTPAQFAVISGNFINAFVPDGAQSGLVRVTTPQGTATSANSFVVLPPQQ